MSWFRRQETLKAGDAAPDFELQSLGGGKVSLAQLRARGPVLLAFFKVSCPVCQMTFPYLERIHKAAASDGQALQVVGISQDKQPATQGFNREFSVTFPTLLDDPKDYAVSNAYGLESVPTLFVVEPDGRISSAVAGFSKRDLQAAAERVGAAAFTASDRVPEFRPG